MHLSWKKKPADHGTWGDENRCSEAAAARCRSTVNINSNASSSTSGNNSTAMPAKDQTRLHIEKMEADCRLRRQRTRELRVTRAVEERRNISVGNPGDVDFIGLVRQWREEHGGAACDHGNPPRTAGGGGAGRDQICVCVRKRPLNSKERSRKEHDAVTCLHLTATVHSARLRVDGISKYCDHNSFRFDHAFDKDATTEEVYRYTARPLVDYVCGGGGGGVPRATVFAYGQTGSGKTHTMGGIQRMVAEDVYLTLSNNAFDNEGRSLENTSVSVAIFEIYGGRIQDLLNGRYRLKVLEDGRGEVVVSGLEEFEANGPRDFLNLIETGHANRNTHAAEANDASSRSHAICQILFRDKHTFKLKGKLSLVDLAGSERGTDTKSHNRQRRTESSETNTSLLALKECIRAIDEDGGHVPYRQSKLTLILKDCFVSRMARTAMVATLSPGSSSTDHTVNTLRYADRIKEKKVSVFGPSKVLRRITLNMNYVCSQCTSFFHVQFSLPFEKLAVCFPLPTGRPYNYQDRPVRNPRCENKWPQSRPSRTSLMITTTILMSST